MTPRELCDLASKINAAVPGLVPDIEARPGTIGCIHVTGSAIETELAAAMMLGRVWAKRWTLFEILANDTATESDHRAFEVLSDAMDVLGPYVATALPGEKQ
jgi:hypothetical protein